MKKKNVKKELIKARKFKNATPGQDRDFETLDANRMFKAYEDVEIDELTVDQKKKREASRERTHGGKSGGERKGLFHGSVDSYKRQAHAADRGQKKPDSNVRKVWQKASSMRSGPKGKLPEEVEITEKEVDVKDTRRTVDAIRAYYRAKDASRDATSDTDKGKKKKGDKEKAYAKKERGEIDKDDPDWKHKKGHTGMHGEARNVPGQQKSERVIDKINRIVKDKQHEKIHGQRVDLYTASAIQQVYAQLKNKNQEKMEKVMSKDARGLKKMADFSWTMMQ